jgi:hypothetical protein
MLARPSRIYTPAMVARIGYFRTSKGRDCAVEDVRHAWIELCWPNASIETGATVAVLISHLGFWSLNACRIVYVIQEDADLQRYGFAYGRYLSTANLERSVSRLNIFPAITAAID